jgi:hypothetical protein
MAGLTTLIARATGIGLLLTSCTPAFASPAAASARCGQTVVSASQWLAGAGVDVHSNGSDQGTGDSCSGLRYLDPRAQYGDGWQCVELVSRLYHLKGWGEIRVDGGPDAGPYRYGAKYLPEGTPDLAFHENGAGYRPVPGDVIVETNSGWGHVAVVGTVGGATRSGHVAVVDTVVGSTVSAIEQNASANGRHAYHLTPAGLVGSYDGSVRGVLHSPRNVAGQTSDNIIRIRKTTSGDTHQLYSATPTHVDESRWSPTSRDPQRRQLISFPKAAIVDIDTAPEPDGTQTLYTATTDGVWQTSWRDGRATSTKVVELAGVLRVVADPQLHDGHITHRLYVLATDGPHEFWWRDGEPLHHTPLAAIAGGLDLLKSVDPDGADEVYVATPNAVWQIRWPVNGGIQTNLVAALPETVDVQETTTPGADVLYIATRTGVVETRSLANGGFSTPTQIVSTSEDIVGIVKRRQSNGIHRLFVATRAHVYRYTWPTSNGIAVDQAIDLPPGDIVDIDVTADSQSLQLYTATGQTVTQTWWAASIPHTTSIVRTLQ